MINQSQYRKSKTQEMYHNDHRTRTGVRQASTEIFDSSEKMAAEPTPKGQPKGVALE